MALLTKYEKAYKTQKNQARHRGIEFLLTFDEWMKIWDDSGHLQERGRGPGTYCMARTGDKGPYVLGNVRIASFEDNRKEQRWSPEVLEKMRQAKLGKKLSEEHKAKIVRYGWKHTPETKQRMSLAAMGNKNGVGRKNRGSG